MIMFNFPFYCKFCLYFSNDVEKKIIRKIFPEYFSNQYLTINILQMENFPHTFLLSCFFLSILLSPYLIRG